MLIKYHQIKPGPMLQRRPALCYSVDLRNQTFTKAVPLKYGNWPQYSRGYIDIFLQCVVNYSSSTMNTYHCSVNAFINQLTFSVHLLRAEAQSVLILTELTIYFDASKRVSATH